MVKLPVAVTLALGILSAAGCIGATAQLMYLIHGRKVAAEYTGLEGKRVAVVCVSRSGSFGPAVEADMLAKGVSTVLKREVKKIDVVPFEEVADWKDQNVWDEVDYRNVGRGVNADMIVAIDLEKFGLHEGVNMFKGKATITVSVLDMKQRGATVFRKEPKDFAFPEHGARHSSETDEASFRRVFIGILAQDIAKRFYTYDMIDNVAMDATFMR
jgi:hypothetical protein